MMSTPEVNLNCYLRGSNFFMDNYNKILQITDLITSFKKNDEDKIVKEFWLSLNIREQEKLRLFLSDEELVGDIMQIFRFIIQHTSSQYATDFLVSYTSLLNNPNIIFPKSKNEYKVLSFFNFIKRIHRKKKTIHLKNVQKKTIQDEFGITDKTLNKWFIYFDLNFPNQREFSSREYSEIVRNFVFVEGIIAEQFEQYFKLTYTKKILSEMLGDHTKSEKTNYRNFKSILENLDCWDNSDNKLLEFIRTHHKLPFSTVYNFLLLMKKNNLLIDSNVKDVFDRYFKC
ncbi:MAG: hypothetical protein ACOVOQ_06360 [Flavobacterium sp.]